MKSQKQKGTTSTRAPETPPPPLPATKRPAPSKTPELITHQGMIVNTRCWQRRNWRDLAPKAAAIAMHYASGRGTTIGGMELCSLFGWWLAGRGRGVNERSFQAWTMVYSNTASPLFEGSEVIPVLNGRRIFSKRHTDHFALIWSPDDPQNCVHLSKEKNTSCSGFPFVSPWKQKSRALCLQMHMYTF